jgi:hypothetical protein
MSCHKPLGRLSVPTGRGFDLLRAVDVTGKQNNETAVTMEMTAFLKVIGDSSLREIRESGWKIGSTLK